MVKRGVVVMVAGVALAVWSVLAVAWGLGVLLGVVAAVFGLGMLTSPATPVLMADSRPRRSEGAR